MSELEEVSFWPGKSGYGSWGQGSSDGSYSRVGPSTAPRVSCKRKTALIIAAVLVLIFIISVAIPGGLLQHYKNVLSAKDATTGKQTAAPHPTEGPPVTGGPTTHIPTSAVPGGDNATTIHDNGTTIQPTSEPKPDFPAWGKPRLPTTVSPYKYELSIILDLFGTETDKEAVIPYKGTVEISLRVHNSTDLIVLHANLTVLSVQVTEIDGADYASVKSFQLNDDQLEIRLSKEYAAGTNLSLKLEFNNTLSDGRHGFYKSSYSYGPELLEKTVIATTQFESVYARNAFPCFDEPSFKAEFKLNITRPKAEGWKSLFNTRLDDHVEYDENRTTDVYGFSPKMSSYLVAFVVSNFASSAKNISSKVDDHTINVRVHGQKSQMSQLEYAMNVTGQVILAYEDFFKVSYPLDKLDIVAIPDFAAGAMENWGLITFRESALLYDKEKSGADQKKYVAGVIAHELAHQWFGNLVTMQWWDDVWLNEGFATFVGNIIGTKAVSDENGHEWPVEADFRADLASSLESDSLLSSHPLSLEPDQVNTRDEIESLFDAISYKKGSGVLNMLYAYVGLNVTKDALHDYLTTNQYGNAEASDLWTAFDKAYHKMMGVSISDEMKTWVKTSGHPFITVDVKDAKIDVIQSRLYLCVTCNKTDHSRQWTIPIAYKAGTKNGAFMLTEAHASIKPESGFAWAKLNLGWNGYYHVKYNQLSAMELQSLSDTDIGNILGDNLLLFRSGNLKPEDLVNTLKRVDNLPSKGYLTWRMMLKTMSYLLDIYDQDYEIYNNISSKVYSWLDVKQLNVTYDHVESLKYEEVITMSRRLSMALAIDHEQVIKDIPDMLHLTTVGAANLLKDSYVVDETIHKDIARQIYTCAFLSNEEVLWSKVWYLYKHTKVPSEQRDYEIILASAADVTLLRRYLDNALEKVRHEDTANVIALVARNRRGRLPAWYFIQSNWATLFERYKATGFTVSRLIRSTTYAFSDESMWKQMKWFFESNDLGAGERAAKQALEIVQANIYMMNVRSHDLTTLLSFV